MKRPREPPKENYSSISMKSKEIVQYMGDKKINAFIKEMNNKYLSWEEFFYRTPPKNADKKIIWTLIKYNRISTAKKIEFGKKKRFEFMFNVSDIMQQKLHELDMNFGGNLGVSQNIPSEEKNKYLINSIMEEAIASSQLEGAATTRKVAKEMLRTARKPKNKSEKMIMNNYFTAKMIKNSKTKKLSPEFILKIHKLISEDTLEDKKDEGKFRKSNDIFVMNSSTGEINHRPPEFHLIPEFIEEICKFANNENNYFMHPIIKASILHFLVGYLHPFVDGNGRTARSLFYWYLLKENYWVIEFMSISKVIIESPGKYSKAYLYTEGDDNDLTYFLKYQLNTLRIALDKLKNYIRKKMNEQKELFKIIEKIENINIRQADILHKFYSNKHKKFSVKEVREIFNVAYETARRDLLRLEKKGFIKKKIIGKKQFIFLRSNNFDSVIKKAI